MCSGPRKLVESDDESVRRVECMEPNLRKLRVLVVESGVEKVGRVKCIKPRALICVRRYGLLLIGVLQGI